MFRTKLVLALLVTLSSSPTLSVAQEGGREAADISSEIQRVRADDKRMAEDALVRYVGARSPSALKDARSADYHSALLARVDDDPVANLSATFVFRSGMDVEELSRFSQKYDLEIMAVDVKAPFNDQGVIQTLHIAADQLLKWDGDSDDRIRKAIGSYRYEFIRRAEKLEQLTGMSTPDSEGYRSVATSPMHIYRCVAFGEAGNVGRSLQEGAVALIVIDPPNATQGKVDSYIAMKEDVERQRAARGRLGNSN